MWRLFRREQHDPEPFYRFLAVEAADALERRHGPLAGRRLVDLGAGPGWYADELRRRGAAVTAVEYDPDELGDRRPAGMVRADAGRLPLPDASVDGVFCSNLLEHTPDTAAVIDDIARVLRPGGWAYVSWTNWYSPWGGHDMTPYHYLGPTRGPARYERRHGPPRKNRYGEGLFAVHVGPTLELVRGRPRLVLESAEPRYWPWAKPVVAVPGLREVVTWNCVLHLRRVDEPPGGPTFEQVWDGLADVEGWMTLAQGRRLWEAARRVPDGGRIVEIGSFRGRSTVVVSTASAADVETVAIDPHAGNDRGPQQWDGYEDEAELDHRAFLDNLARFGVSGKVRHVRRFSDAAHGDVDGGVDLLYVDGAHRFAPARADIRDWGDRVRPGGTMCIHDSFSSVGVTLAILAQLVGSGRWRYVGRSGSLTEYRREPVRGRARWANAAAQLLQLPWFARNLVIKALVVARLAPLTRVLGHRGGGWPY
jgi:SAM-dependent methyltransferase